MTQSRRRTVLVVDDDEDLCALVAAVLVEEGYAVETAANGQEALTAVERNLPDLIVLDMKMPVMDGREFARKFHSLYDHLSPIVILTASVDGRVRADEVEATDWLAKPFDLGALVESVERNLRP
ncbi:MAG TPA: response regulator [Chloroflexota bacterium]